ncbi:MAG: M28 family peptidase [Prevotellaceae bacterium]|jgi:hypothetical protein|nr:M28 family peptidase [Prevotellaceae bacterium]
MKKILLIISILTLNICGTLAQQPQLTQTEKYLDAMHKYITSEKLFGYVKHLSDSAFEGRLAGSKGMEKAARWAQERFKEWGLEQVVGAKNYIQDYPHPSIEVMPGSTMNIWLPVAQAKSKEPVWVAKQYPWGEWYAGGTSGNGEITAEVVYAGFGVTAPEVGYDDYKGIDVKGKIVLIEGETPNTSRECADLEKWYPYTLHQHKVENAVKHGAVGMLYKWVPGPNNGYDPNFIYAYVTTPIVNDLFAGTGHEYEKVIEKIKKEKNPASFNMGKRATIKMNTVYNPNAKGLNVIGMVKGSDPKLADELVIVSGHLDHLGMIPHHIAGANDNNSSTAVLMGVAEAFAKSEAKPKRSILFINIDGEEAGLTGSDYYTKNPLVPQNKVHAVINLEQVGVGEYIRIGYREGNPELQDYFNAANTKYVHRLLRMWANAHITRPRTDGAVFMKAGYPCVDIGAFGGGWRSYYHDPRDDWNTINPEILQDVAKLVYWTTIEIADK